MNEIFISYSHKDANFVSLLQEGLELNRREIWRDIHRMRGGQIMDREVGDAILNAALFVPVISQHFDQSSWLYHELAAAMAAGIPVVPVVAQGVKPPLTVSGFKQLRVSVIDGSIPSGELLGVIKSISAVAGQPRSTDYDDDDMDSSDCLCVGTEDLKEALIGSKWTWCENGQFLDTGLSIEFEKHGKLRRSWRADPAQWKVSENGFVIYKPHILKFDEHCQTFQGATADPTQPVPERSGQRISG